jgi:hypothetical protein
LLQFPDFQNKRVQLLKLLRLCLAAKVPDSQVLVALQIKVPDITNQQFKVPDCLLQVFDMLA